MSEQIFISYRRDGGDIYAKAICDALKVRGYSVFYDFDSLQGGYFDSRIITAIEECNDFVLVLPQGSLDRCQNYDDWVRLEIRHALECGKNIIPVMLPGFSFPKNLPDDISAISRLNGIDFVMGYFDLAVIPTIVSRLISAAGDSAENGNENKQESEGSQRLEYKLTLNDDEYEVSLGRCTDEIITIPTSFKGKPVTSIAEGGFKNYRSLKAITIPESVTIIGAQAFFGCTALTSITIPSKITSISGNVLKGCESLTNIIFKGTKKQWKAVKSFRGWKLGHTVTVNCTDGDIKMK